MILYKFPNGDDNETMVLVTLSSLDKLINELKDVLLDEFSELKGKSGDYHLKFLRSMVEYLNTLNNSKEPILNLKYIEVIERNVLYRTTML